MIDLHEDKGRKIINPDDTDNGGKPMSTGGLGKRVVSFYDDIGFWQPVFTLGNGDREAENRLVDLEHTDLLGPNLNHIPESVSFSLYYVNLTLKHDSDIICNSYRGS